ncbi:Cystatin-related plant [Arabidopsis thaliana x Arabidopsis arenosa]|uniref:Cystatin-related plant n=1 Tax=Arabidopsis thaliana x Arabidopsis arenosa TaxID=1240361 RepID=A0A8T2ABX8_9BRAS|nr:Cystatin-related plant [Arabidopsis thaliana x Arabidopsis arenosa]
MGDDSDKSDSMGDEIDKSDSMKDDSDRSDSMGEDCGEDYVEDLADWIDWMEPVHLRYTDEDDVDGTRFYPFIRRREDEERISPEEEYLLMKKQVEESKGFDIDFTKFRCLFNYTPVDLDLENQFVFEPETTRGLLNRLSQTSLEKFNEKYTSNYEFVKVIKANYHFCAGIMFFITFQGKLLSDSKLFQAKLRFCGRLTGFISCELKPDKNAHYIEALEKEDPKKPRLTLEPSYV